MDKGKFSQPRPYRDEERQIEEAFRQITGKEPVKKQVPVPEPVIPETSADTDSVLEEAIRLTSEHPPRQTSPEAFPPESGYFREDSFSFPTEQEKPLPGETAEEPLPFLETVMNFCYDNKKPILVGLCGIALVLLMAVIGIFAFGGSKKEDDRILQNVYLADIPVGGMTKNEAISAVKQATSHTYAATDMVVDLAGTELRLAPKKTGAKLDVKAAVNAAYSYGRTGTKEEQQRAQEESAYTDYIIGLLPYLHLDTDYIRKTLEASASGSGSTLTQASYGLEGKYPELGVEKFDENAYELFRGSPSRLLRDGERIDLGGRSIEIIHTPGHSQGSVCYLCNDEFLITGDTLFSNNYGRCDLWSGNDEEMRQSLLRLRTLPSSLTIYPGHGDTARLGDALDEVAYLL